MRNDNYIAGPRDYKTYGVTSTGEEHPWFFGYNHHVSQDTCRDDAVSTVPTESGQYFAPTIYSAHWYEMRSTDFSMDYEIYDLYSPYPKFRHKGQSASAFWPIPFNTAGCVNTSRPYKPDVPLYLLSEAESLALAEMKSRDFDVGVFLAELPETVEFLGGLVEAAFAMWQSIFGKQGSKRPSTRDLAKMWLAWQLAVKPLAYDIYDGAKRFVSNYDPPPFKKVSVSRLDPDFKELTMPPPAYYYTKDKSTLRRGVTVELLYRVGNPILYNLDSLGLINPASVLWERMPLSFVIDYFVNVGDFLSALTAPVGVDFVAGSRTTWVNNSYNVSYAPVSADNEPHGHWPNITGTLKAMSRTVYNDFPLPIPWGHIPGSATRWLNMIGLIRARY